MATKNILFAESVGSNPAPLAQNPAGLRDVHCGRGVRLACGWEQMMMPAALMALEHTPSARTRETSNGLAEDTDGGIWIATQGTDAGGRSGRGGLYRYRSVMLTKYLRRIA